MSTAVATKSSQNEGVSKGPNGSCEPLKRAFGVKDGEVYCSVLKTRVAIVGGVCQQAERCQGVERF